MISEERLSGFVDQIESVLHFQGEKTFFFIVFQSFLFLSLFFVRPASEQLAQWDRRIESFCVQVNKIFDKIQTVHPDWCAKSLATIETKINAAVPNDDEEMPGEETNPTEVRAMEVS